MAAPRPLPPWLPLWLLCGALGFGLLWPWQTVLNTLPAIQLLFPATPGLATYCALAFNSPQLPTHLLVLAAGHRSSPSARLRGGFAALAGLLVALPLGVRGLSEEAGDDFVFWFCALMGAAVAVIESTLFGCAAVLRGGLAARATQLVLAGEGVAAVLANAAQLSLQSGLPDGVRESLLEASFFTAAAVMLLCAALVPRFADVVEAESDARAAAAQPLGGEASAAGGGLRAAAARIWQLLRACWRTCLCIFVNMAILFSIFPGIVASVPYVGNDAGAPVLSARGSLAWALLLFGLFSVTDLAGRLLAGLRACGGPGACGGRADDADEKCFAAPEVGAGAGTDAGTEEALLSSGAGPASPMRKSPSETLLEGRMRKSSSQSLIDGSSGGRDKVVVAGGETALLIAPDSPRSTGRSDADNGKSGGGGGGGGGSGGGGGGSGGAGESGSDGGGGDTFGPLASTARRRGWSAPLMRRVVLLELLTWARLAYVPVFLLASQRQLGAFGSLQDAAVALAMVALGLSNGHAATLAMVAGPRLVAHEYRDGAGILHVFSRVGGLWIGAVIGTALEPGFRSQVAVE